MSKEFKVGDKVYVPYYGTGIFIVSTNSYNEDLNKYPFAVGAKTFTVHGKSDDYGPLQEVFHATTENHALLERLYGVEFEKPATSHEIIKALLAKGHENIPCWASEDFEQPNHDDKWVFITYCDDRPYAEYPYTDSVGYYWKYATPFDYATGQPITELPE